MKLKRRVKRALAHRTVQFTDESDRIARGLHPEVLIMSESALQRAEAKFGGEQEEVPACWIVVGSVPAAHPVAAKRDVRALTRDGSVSEWRVKLDEALDGLPVPPAPPGVSRSVSLDQMVCESRVMSDLVHTVRRVSSSAITILLLGETGVGKDYLARAIHHESARSRGPFIAVNCAALPEALLESELFGHTRGAFTDAVRERRGKFELAHGGTLLLDEVGDMPIHLQTKLLRVLQEREVERVGSEETLSVDVRVIAATNQDLMEALSRRMFRADLYYRLSGVTFTIPPLRERLNDLLPLAEQRIQHVCAREGKSALRLTLDAVSHLLSHSWPGNIRELHNVIDRAVLLAPESGIRPEDLVLTLAAPAETSTGTRDDHAIRDVTDWSGIPFEEAKESVLASFEMTYLKQILGKTRGRVGEAAALMGINPRSVYEKLKKYGIDKRDYRSSPS
jgi:transcriptional regulator with GAF, ATPase, and Fis domain